MPSIMRSRRLKCVPCGPNIKINYAHPLSKGLICAYLPGISLNDFTGINGPLAYVDIDHANGVCTGIPTACLEGPSIGNVGNTKDAFATAKGAIDKRLAAWSSSMSWYLRIDSVTITTTAAGGFFFLYDGTNVSTGFAPASPTSSTGTAQLYYSPAFTATAAGAAWTAGIHGFLASINVTAGTSNVWKDGGTVYITSTAVAASTAVTANTWLNLNSMPDNQTLAFYCWDHALTLQDSLMIDADPYGIFMPVGAPSLLQYAEGTYRRFDNPCPDLPGYW